MKNNEEFLKFRNFIGKTMIVLLMVSFVIFKTKSTEAVQSSHSSSFAVVELFTSEGCSSCPPADLLLSKLTDLAQTQNLPIYTLSFHVDYWNYIGWKDSFSSEQYSKRQRYYALVSHADTVYTPQMIINGTDSFSGYREELAKQAIDKVLSIPSSVQISIVSKELSNNQIELTYAIGNAESGLVLNIALVENGLSSRVTGGENAGHTLTHSNVVRLFKTIPLKNFSGKINLSIPDFMKKQNGAVIAYLQDPTTMVIRGAVKFNLRS